jgi:opacity protein-like surface antigen
MYIKPKLKLNDSVEVFARFGAVESKLKASSGVESASEKHSSPSYGAGLSYSIHPSYSIGADFMQHLSKDGTKVNGWSVGVGFRF